MSEPRQVAVFLYEEVEDLDFAGPLEVFGAYGRPGENNAFRVATVGQKPGFLKTRNGLEIRPAHDFGNCPPVNILVVPGGQGSRREINNPAALDWVKQTAEKAEFVLTVCTGSLILAKAGLLDGLSATSHFMALDLLAELAPTATLRPGERFVDNGRIICSAGVSAGIDAALYLVAKLHGPEKARQTADYIEYEYYRPSA